MKKKTYQQRQQRIFSDDLSRQIIGQVERGEFTVSQVVREYQVSIKQYIIGFTDILLLSEKEHE